MKKQWRALCMAWGMFCIVPCPSRKWDEAARSWMIAWFPLVGLLVGGVWLLLTLLPVCTRAAAGLCVSTMRPMAASQYGGDFAQEKKTPQCVCLALWLALALIGGWLLCGVRTIALGAGALCVWLAALYGRGQLGGMSGDVSGFALTLGELAGILCLCIF